MTGYMYGTSEFVLFLSAIEFVARDFEGEIIC